MHNVWGSVRACKNICALYETEKQEGYGEMASKYFIHMYMGAGNRFDFC